MSRESEFVGVIGQIARHRKFNRLGVATELAEFAISLLDHVSSDLLQQEGSRLYYEIGYLEKTKGDLVRAAVSFDTSGAFAARNGDVPGDVFARLHGILCRYYLESLSCSQAIEETRELQEELNLASEAQKNSGLGVNARAILMKRLSEYLFDANSASYPGQYENLMGEPRIEEMRENGFAQYELIRWQGRARIAELNDNTDVAIEIYSGILGFEPPYELRTGAFHGASELAELSQSMIDEALRDYWHLGFLLSKSSSTRAQGLAVLRKALSLMGDKTVPLFQRQISDHLAAFN